MAVSYKIDDEHFDKVLKQYEYVRNAIILTQRKLSILEIAPLNEIRNALFHIFRCYDDEGKGVKYELDAANVHFKRSLYDAFEIFIDNVSSTINEYYVDYNPAIVEIVFKKYYDEILPYVNDLKYQLNTERSTRRKDSLKAAESIFLRFKVVSGYLLEIESHKPLIAREAAAHRSRKNKRILIGVSISTAIGIVGGILTGIFL